MLVGTRFLQSDLTMYERADVKSVVIAATAAKMMLAAMAVGAFVFAPQTSAMPMAGDDDGDGVIMEDESGWDCTTMGNRVCGNSFDNALVMGRLQVGGWE